MPLKLNALQGTSNNLYEARLYEAKKYDPNNCKRKKRSAAEIEEEDKQMKKKMSEAFISSVKAVAQQDEQEDENAAFCKSVQMQMKKVLLLQTLIFTQCHNYVST